MTETRNESIDNQGLKRINRFALDECEYPCIFYCLTILAVTGTGCAIYSPYRV